MEKFRVALSGDFIKVDGSLAFPSIDLSPLVARISSSPTSMVIESST